MRAIVRLLAVILALVAGGVAWAQEPRGWIGADTQDVIKAEAERLGWDGPRGAKIKLVAPGSPADKAGLKEGDIVILIEGTEVETSTGFEAAVAAKPPGADLRLRVRSGAQERRVAISVAEPPRAQPSDPSAAPILMLDTGGHMALIRSLLFTSNGKQIVSAGDDKTIRVWDWQAGKTLRTIRGQVGSGAEGQIYALALSPDGRWLAAGGFMAQGFGVRDDDVGDIRLYDFASGKLAALLKGHTGSVNGVAFSPNGKLLLSGDGAASAIIWDVEKRAQLHVLQGHTAEIYAVGFTPDGARAVTGSFDATLKLWSVTDGKDLATLTGHMHQVRSLAVSSIDGSIASGDRGGEIRLWNSRTGGYLRTLANHGGSVAALGFSSDGKQLLSTCGGGGCTSVQHVWDVATGAEHVAYTKHNHIVLAASVNTDGGLVATGDHQEIHIWHLKTGEMRRVLAGTGAPRLAAAYSTDGQRIAWGNMRLSPTSKASNPIEFQLRLPISQPLGEPERVTGDGATAFLRARTAYGAYTLAHRPGGSYGFDDAILDVKKDGRTVASIERDPTNGVRHAAYTFTPDGQTIISAGDSGFLTAYDLNGGKLGDFVGHDGDVWAVTPSPDGRLLVSGSDDQTVRLWNLKTRELIVTLFHGSDG
jgi:WD40 repeat protein